MNCVIDKMTSPRSLLMIQRAKELQKSDSSYISLAGGEPDFDTPAAVTEAAIAKLTAEMREAARLLEFEHAAYLRDKIARLKETL